MKLGETTIVQPDFHQETVDISKNVYIQLLKRTVEQVELISKVDVLNFSMKQYYPIVDLAVYLKAPINYDVAKKCAEFKNSSVMNLIYTLSLNQ